MTRLPRTGRNKTRLIPALGADGATTFHERLARHAIGRASSFCTLHPKARLTVRLEGGISIEGKTWLGSDELDCREQAPGDLGQRMETAANEVFDQGADRVVIIGTDCPSIDESTLAKAFDALNHSDVVFGPAADGGYYLVGLNKPTPSIFRNIPWGGEQVLNESLAAAKKAGVRVQLLDVLSDVDMPEDLTAAETQLSKGATVSVIIPTLNEAGNITSILEKIAVSNPHEIIVADGGSTDGTTDLARATGVRVTSSPKGRAAQMNHGASIATGEFLLFLHADTLPPEGFPHIIANTLNRPNTAAGAFRFRLSGDMGASPLIESLVNLRCRFFGTPYGDQGIFVRRALFQNLGGFPNLQAMEDLHFIRKARKSGKIRGTDQAAVTSPRRWEKSGLIRTFLGHQLMLASGRIGIWPRIISRLRD
tara:strand:- start:22970 stop:24238 length:1269 start_codon:yes stop_codon:yes gene_type:complete